MASKVSREILTVPQAKAMADAWARSMHLGGEGARFEGALLAMRHKLAAPVALVPADSDEDKVLEQDCTNIGFALYEKVHRAKTRWRLTLRHGVFHIGGRDYLFNKAAGDLQFT